MAKVLNILKNINIKILFVTFLFFIIFPTIPSFADDELPMCSAINAGSARCICEDNWIRDDLICEVGQACKALQITSTSSTSSASFSSTSYTCIAISQAPNTNDTSVNIGGSVSTHIQSADSSKFDKTVDACKAKETKCSPKCYYDEVIGNCTFCPLFATFFRAASVMTRKAIDGYSGSVYKVVIIGFAVWIALQILVFVSSPEVRDLKDLVLAIITQSLFVLIAVILLQSGAFSFLNDALSPIFNTGMNAAEAILTPEGAGANTNESLKQAKNLNKTLNNNYDSSGQDTEVEEYKCESMAKYNLPDTKTEGALPKKMGEGILCTMGLIQNRAARVKALGSASICYSWQKKAFIIPHLGYLLVGIGLWVGGMLVLLAVPFMMIDSVLQLAVAGSLLPFAIGAYAFKATRQYTGKVWETFMNAMFAFVFVSLIALMITTALEQIITNATANTNVLFKEYADGVQMELLLNDLSWFSSKFLEVCFVLILAWSVIGEATDFAKQFSGSITSTKIGSSIGTMAGSFTKSAATKILDKPVSAAADKAWSLTKDAGSGLVGGIRQVRLNRQADRIKKKGTYDATTGTYTYNTKSWLRRRSKTLSLSETADGRKTVTESKIKKKSGGATETITKVKNKDFTVETTTIRDKEGNITSYNDEIKTNSNFLNKLFEKNGTVNQENYKKALEAIHGQPNEEQLMIALQKQIISKTMPNTKMKMKNHGYVSQKAIRDKNGNIIGFEEVHADGSKTIVNTRMDKNGRMMTEMTQIDKKGRGTNLATDGVINRKRTFHINGNVADVDMQNWQQSADESSIRDTYGYSAYYDYYNKTRRYSKLNEGLKTSAFSEDEINAARNYTAVKGNEMAYANMYEFERYNG